jgi:MFS family permease
MTQSCLPIQDSAVRWNIRQLCWDAFWFGTLAGATLAFLAVYSARIGASSLQIGLLGAGPAVVGLLFSLPFGRWLEGKSLIRSTYLSAFSKSVGYLVLVSIPWLFIEPQMQAWVIVVLILVMSVAGTLSAISFNALYAEIVPVEWLGRAAGWRTALLAVIVALTTILSSFLLERIIFPLNYQVVFLIGACGALMSSYHLSRIRHPSDLDAHTWDLSTSMRVSIILAHWLDWIRKIVRKNTGEPISRKHILRMDLISSPFGLFMAGCLIFYTVQYFSVPIFPLYYVNILHMTDGEIGLGCAIMYASMMIGSLFANRMSVALGHRKLMLLGMTLFGQYTLLLGLSRDATLYYVACLFGGVLSSFLGIGLVNRLMERTPADDRSAHMVLHAIALNIGILAGSLLGPLFGEWIGLRDVLFVSTGLRLLAAVLMWMWG